MLTDIDGTLTTEGRLTAAAYGALERLQQAGVKVVPVTGRRLAHESTRQSLRRFELL